MYLLSKLTEDREVGAPLTLKGGPVGKHCPGAKAERLVPRVRSLGGH